jgi:hypothetical protein
MINLLPPKDRLSIEIAKRNTVLRRYLELALLSAVLLAVLVTGSYYFLKLQEKNTKKTIEINNQKLSSLSPVEDEAKQLSATVKTISALLSREINFSSMLTSIGQLVPKNAVLSGLELSSTDTNAPLSISAQVVDENTAAVLRNNLAGSYIFDKADIKSITKIGEDSPDGSSSTQQDIKKDSPYKFIVIIDAYFKGGVTKK